jgi:hypothetical protein
LTGALLVGIFVVAVALRLLNLAMIPDLDVHALIEDSSIYWEGAAASIDAGYFARYGAVSFVPETERVPLYFLFLIPIRLLFGDAVMPVLVGQALLDAVTCVVIARLGAMVDRNTGVLSGLLAAAWPNLIIHSSLILTDSLFVLLFSLLLLFSAKFLTTARLFDAGIAGLLCGLAIMTRSVAQFIPFVMAAAAPYIVHAHGKSRKSAAAAALVVLAMAALPVAPILVRNISQFDTVHLTSQKGTVLLNWFLGYSQSLATGDTFADSSKASNKVVEARSTQMGVDPTSLNPFEESAIKIELAKEGFHKIPLSVLLRGWVSGAVVNLASPALVLEPRIRQFNRKSFMESTGVGVFERARNFISNNNSTYVAWLMFGLMMSALTLTLQFGGWFLLCRRLPVATLFATLSLLYFLVLNGPVASPKYRLPLEPILIIFQGFAIIWLLGWLRSHIAGKHSSDRNVETG